MATRLVQALKKRGEHHVGNLNSINIKTVAHGALVVEEDIDNFTMCELGFNEEGERTCKQLSDLAKKGYLIASPETLSMGEEHVDFYNAVGERARIVVFEPEYTRFETSAFKVDEGSEVKAGQVAHWDVDAKSFLIHDGAHEDYNGAANKFLVIKDEEDLDYTLGKEMVMLEVIE